MKKPGLLICLFFFSLSAFSQSAAQMITSMEKAYKVIKADKTLSHQFKAVAGKVLQADEGCRIPPGCEIINPWTCECEVGLKDPWGKKKSVSSNRLKSVLAFERAIAEGLGGKLLPKNLNNQAKGKFPSNKLKDVQGRMHIYVQKIIEEVQ